MTIEELKEYIDTHCSIGVDCEEENGEVWCINHASKELRDEYASKYGCICGACCRKCIQFKECYPNGQCEHLCKPEACREKGLDISKSLYSLEKKIKLIEEE